MRYSIRNQNKIIEAFSKELLIELHKALKINLENNTIETDKALPYNTLKVVYNNAEYTLYIIGVTFDVLNLAFKEVKNK